MLQAKILLMFLSVLFISEYVQRKPCSSVHPCFISEITEWNLALGRSMLMAVM